MPRNEEIIIEAGPWREQVIFKTHKKKHHHHHHDCPTWEEVERLREANDALCRDRDAYKVELDRSNVIISRYEDRDGQQRHEIEDLRKASRSWESMRLGWEAALEKLRNRLTRSDNELERQRAINDRLEGKMAKKEQDNSRLQQQVDRLTDDVCRLEREIRHLRHKVDYYESAPPYSGRPGRY